ncbi:hypothetical protein CAPTEDRAFT_148107 [Capitella teleta]|uniref:Fuseless n=1 Tax=Capitella teleta TaxID=283909 RepID=R7VD04_CAPTE|nr:hypothetical protein CAPTEDRAFT_148107 [Capitella teleta]|eukprot:ELU16529.1 hypothetical protein CAPTEDRAFT_148107 [Capitella teleta]
MPPEIWSSKRRWLFLAIDQLFAILVIAPLVIGFWRGTWSLLDIYITPEDPWRSHWITIGVGNCGLFLLAVFQDPLQRLHTNSKWKVVKMVMPRVYVYVGSLLSVCQWRGLWGGLDVFSGMTSSSYLHYGIAGQVFLWLFRSSKNIAGSPTQICVDTADDLYVCTSRFKVKRENRELYAWDQFFSSVVVWNALVLVWRGLWGLMDKHLLPEDELQSAWASVGIGTLGVLVNLPLQIVANLLYTRTRSFMLRVLLEEGLAILVSFATIQTWRGVWVIYDLQFLPDSYTLSCWLTHSIGMLLLMIGLCGSSNIGKGCSTSGDTEPFYGCLLDIEYFQYFFPKAAGRKMVREERNNNANQNGMSNKKNDILLEDRVSSECEKEPQTERIVA